MYSLFLFCLFNILFAYAHDKQLIKYDVYSKQINHYYPHKSIYTPTYYKHQFKLVCKCFYK